jgi:hypothetical protein
MDNVTGGGGVRKSKCMQGREIMKHLIAIKVFGMIKKWLYLILVIVLVTSIGKGGSAWAFSPSDCDELSRIDQGGPLSCDLVDNHRESHYIIDEIVGDELVSITEEIGQHSDFALLFDLAKQNNYGQTGLEVYEIRSESGMRKQESLFRFARLDFEASDGASIAQLVFFDFGDHVITGLGLISVNSNGYKIVEVYEVVRGQAVLTDHIDAENVTKTALQTQQQINAPDNCTICQFTCSSIVAGGGCGLGGYFACNAICVPIGWASCPVICAVVWGIVCGGGGFIGCNAICNGLGFCP